MIHLSRPFRERGTGRRPDLAFASRIRRRFHPFREQWGAAAAVVSAVTTVTTVTAVTAVTAVAPLAASA